MHIYVVTDSENVMYHEIEYIKIGITSSNDIRGRISQLQTGNPRIIRLVALFDIGGCETTLRGCERLLHWNFARNRASGEWFFFDEDIHPTLEAFAKLSNPWWYWQGSAKLDAEGIRYPELFEDLNPPEITEQQ